MPSSTRRVSQMLKLQAQARQVDAPAQEGASQAVPALTVDQFQHELMLLFQAARQAQQFAAALKAIELVGKTRGFLQTPTKPTDVTDFSLTHLSDTALDQLVVSLEEEAGDYGVSGPAAVNPAGKKSVGARPAPRSGCTQQTSVQQVSAKRRPGKVIAKG